MYWKILRENERKIKRASERLEAETERFMHQQYIAMQNQLRPQVTGHS